MKTSRLLLAFMLVILFFSNCSQEKIDSKTETIIEPVAANYLVLKPSKFITKTEKNLPVIYLKNIGQVDGFNNVILSTWSKADGSIIDLTYYNKKHLPTSVSYSVLDTISGISSALYYDKYSYSAVINTYLSGVKQSIKEDAKIIPNKNWFKVKIKYTTSWLKYDVSNKKIIKFNTETIKDKTKILPLLLIILFFMANLMMAFKKANKQNYWSFVIMVSFIATILLITFLGSSISLLPLESSVNYPIRVFFGLLSGYCFFIIFTLFCSIENTKKFNNYKKIYLIFVAAVFGALLFKLITATYINSWLATLVTFLIIFSPVVVIFIKILSNKKNL